MKNGYSSEDISVAGRIDPERRIALAYVGAKLRPALTALWGLDAALSAVIAAGSPAMIRQIKLAWWREALVALDQAQAPPEPVLKQLQSLVLPLGISGTSLSEMTEGWEHLLGEEQLSGDELASYARFRGGRMFALSAMVLGATSSGYVERAGEGWALVDLARRSSRPEDREMALETARRSLSATKWPTSLRALGMLAVLARRDAMRGAKQVEQQGGPARLLRMLAHRITGR